ncbi:MAG: hypothetical protein WCG66_12860, partial [bacterium]
TYTNPSKNNGVLCATLTFKWNDVDAIIDGNEEDLLPRILFLIGVLSHPPDIPSSEVDDNGLETHMTRFFEELVFVGIPVKLHKKRMP